MDCSPPGCSVHGILPATYWSGLPFPSPGALPDSGIERGFPALQADSLPSEPLGKSKVKKKQKTAGPHRRHPQTTWDAPSPKPRAGLNSPGHLSVGAELEPREEPTLT